VSTVCSHAYRKYQTGSSKQLHARPSARAQASGFLGQSVECRYKVLKLKKIPNLVIRIFHGHPFTGPPWLITVSCTGNKKNLSQFDLLFMILKGRRLNFNTSALYSLGYLSVYVNSNPFCLHAVIYGNFANCLSTLPTVSLLCQPSLYFANRLSTLPTFSLLCRPFLYFANRLSTLSTVSLLCQPSLYFANRLSTLPTLSPLCQPSLYFANPLYTLPTVSLQYFATLLSILPTVYLLCKPSLYFANLLSTLPTFSLICQPFFCFATLLPNFQTFFLFFQPSL
jgi:hypothetical protein